MIRGGIYGRVVDFYTAAECIPRHSGGVDHERTGLFGSIFPLMINPDFVHVNSMTRSQLLVLLV